MSKYVVDAFVVLELLREGVDPSTEHELLAPTLIRSQVLEALYQAARSGDIARKDALDRLARFATMKIRYLGDKVLRRQAWTVAEQLGLDSTHGAEYVALTQLQADYLVTLDPNLASQARKVVEVMGIEALHE